MNDLRRAAEMALEALQSYLTYDSENGVFYWTENQTKRLRNKQAGYIDSRGYMCIKFRTKNYKLHRLAWLFYYKELPSKDIDHIDRNKLNNKIENLRLATKQLNQWNHNSARINNKCGYRGVCNYRGKFAASIKSNHKSKWLGIFDTPELAHQAYLKAKNDLHKGALT
jgi:ribosomal protein S17E